MKQHKWHKEIKAWADGAEIESAWFDDKYQWSLDVNPEWSEDMLYRIKPQPKEPQFEEYITPYADVNIIFKPQPKEPQYLYVYGDIGGIIDLSPIYFGKDKYIGKIKLELENE